MRRGARVRGRLPHLQGVRVHQVRVGDKITFTFLCQTPKSN
jgi:hypothetical protein